MAAYFGGDYGPDDARELEVHRENKSRRGLLWAIGGIAVVGGAMGSFFTVVTPTNRQVTETKVIKTVVEKPQPAPPPDPCQTDEGMKVEKVYSEKVSTATEKDKDAWTWGNVVIFSHKSGGVAIICQYSGSAELQKILEKGMTLKPQDVAKVPG